MAVNYLSPHLFVKWQKIVIFVVNIYIVVKDIKINQFINYFKNSNRITKSDIWEYFRKTEKGITENTLKWRIHNLKKENVIKSIGRGIYAITDKTAYKPEPDNLIKKASKIFLSRYDEINYCVWNSSWLYDFMIHQPFTSFYVFEVEKEVCKETFNLFKDESLNAFYQPNEDLIDNYVSDSKNAIIVKPLISRSPINIVKNVKLASVEKILVDIYCDQDIYPVFNLSEQVNIFENMTDSYIVNFSKLISYSKRRNREEALKAFINNNFDNLLNDILQ